MFSTTRHHLPHIGSFEEAAYIWGQKAKPRGRDWEDHQRPLGSNRQHHYRLENHGDHFDVCLYRTVMARYHKPQGDTKLVEYAGDDSSTSKQFMWHVLGVSLLHSEDGIALPIDTSRRLNTTIVYVNGKLDLSQCSCPKLYVKRTSAERKLERKALIAEHADLLAVMQLRVPYLRQTGGTALGYTQYSNALQKTRGTPEYGAAFVSFGDAVAWYMLHTDRRSFNEKTFAQALKKELFCIYRLSLLDDDVELPAYMPVADVPRSAFTKE